MSGAVSLALHAMAYLAADPGRRISTQEVAEALGASQAHLSVVLQRLKLAETHVSDLSNVFRSGNNGP